MLAQAIKVEARRLGFELVGLTTPDPPPHQTVYENWLQAGRHGEMDYLASPRARLRRANPRHILPECRSILALGIPYYRPIDEANHEVSGRLAAYAWGDDYHDLLPERLRALTGFIEAQAGGPVPNRWYTDSGPLLERDLAQRAGLGWIGKNTCLINPHKGSYFLLAEILLGIDLPADPPFTADRCGSCTRCLQACPTGCILPDRTLDARRCLSYLTIELKGTIPAELRPALGSWVFGCDICQQVCPWNQSSASPCGDPAFAPRPGLANPRLVAELALNAQDFNRKFKASPVQRARRRGYLRNVAVALGNAYAGSEDPEAVNALAQALQHDAEPLVRLHATWSLAQVGGQAARQTLAEAIQTEVDPSVRCEIEAASLINIH